MPHSVLPLTPDLATLLLAQAADLISLHDLDGQFRWASPAARYVLGYAPEALVALPGLTYVAPEDVTSVAAALAQLSADSAEGPECHVVYRALRADGALVWLESHARAVRDEATGALTMIVVVSRDVSSRERTARAARRHAAHLEAIFEHAPVGITLLRAIRAEIAGDIIDFEYVRRNGRARGDTQQVETEELAGRRLLTELPIALNTSFPRFCAALNTGQPWAGEVMYPAAQQAHWYDSAVIPLPDDELLVAWNDLTSARQLEARIVEEQRVFEAIFDSSAAGLSIFEAERDAAGAVVDFRVVRRNSQARRLLNLTSPDENALFSATYPLMMTNGLFTAMQGVLATGETYHREVSYEENMIRGWFDVYFTRLDEHRVCTSFSDLTPIRRAEEELRQEHQVLEAVFNASGAGIVVLREALPVRGGSADFEVMRANSTAARAVGLASGAEMIGTQLLRDFPLLADQELLGEYRQVLTSGEPWTVERRYAGAGISGWFRISVTRLDAHQLCVVFFDTTDAHHAEQKASDARAQLALAADAAGLGLSVREVATSELDVTATFARLYGLPPTTTRVGLATLLDLTHPDDRRTLRPSFEQGLAVAGATRQAQFRIHRADTGEERTLLSTARAIAVDGRPERVLSVTLDVTDTARAHVANEQLHYWKALTEGLPEILWVADATSTTTHLFNRRWFDYTGHSEDILRNDPWVRAIHPADAADPEMQRVVREQIAVGLAYEVKFRLRRHDGAWRWFLTRAVPLLNAAGLITNWVGLTMDIHEREVAERALRRANADLDTFVYAAAHDLKSPIDNLEAVIVALREEFAERLRTYPSPFDAAIGELCDHAERAVSRFRVTLADLAQVVDSQAPDHLPDQSLDLATYVADLVLDMEAEFVAAHGTLCLDLDVPTLRALPPRHLRTVLFNLIGNALKYRQPARPARLWLRTRAVSASWIELALTDNGLGLDSARAARAFELFGRLHPGAAGGTGIGLFIVRRVVEQAGGKLRVNGRIGEGTTFAIRLPRH